MTKYYTGITICLTALVVVLFQGTGLSIEPQTLFQEEGYYQELHRLFSQAESSIDIVIDAIEVTPPEPHSHIDKLIELLLEAGGRGVRVRVILEDAKSPKNFIAYRKLLEGGLDVYFDSSKLLVNSKSIVIDSRICVVSGMSWTPEAWDKKNTIAVVLDSGEMAKTVGDSVSKLLTVERTPFIAERAEGVLIPDDFLLLKRFGRRLIEERANDAFDLYLFLIKIAQERAGTEFRIDYVKWGASLCSKRKTLKKFSNEEQKERFYHRTISTALTALSKRYGFVEYDKKGGKVTLPKLFDIDPGKSAETHPCFVLPYAFWEADIPATLPLEAKYIYLIALLESRKSERFPYWFSNPGMLSDFYGLSPHTVDAGLDRLEKMNIIEIARAPGAREASGKGERDVYRINRIIPKEEFDKRIEEFEREHGGELTEQARNEALQLNEPNDFLIIKTFIGLIKKYGYPAVRQANVDTVRHQRGSSLSCISTTIKMLEEAQQ